MQPTKRQRVAYDFSPMIASIKSMEWSSVLEMLGWPADQPEMLPVPHNVVLTAILAGGQPVEACCGSLNSKHNPGQFASAQLKELQCKILNYFHKKPVENRTGRCISVGARTPNEAFGGLLRLRNRVYQYPANEGERFYFAGVPTVSNIVFSGKFPYAFDNAQIMINYPLIVTYEPEWFSGACIKPFPEHKGRTGKLFEGGAFTTLGITKIKQAVDLELCLIRMIAPYRVTEWKRVSKLMERVQEVRTANADSHKKSREREAGLLLELLKGGEFEENY